MLKLKEVDRQTTLLKWAAEEIHCLQGDESLIPLGRHGSFHSGMIGFEYWGDKTLLDLSWWAVGRCLAECAPCERVIDHAWLFGFHLPPGEPWGLITEPYLSLLRAQGISYLASDAMREWGVEVRVLNSAQSSWAPWLECHPLVVSVNGSGPKAYNLFVRRAVAWAMNRYSSGDGV